MVLLIDRGQKLRTFLKKCLWNKAFQFSTCCVWHLGLEMKIKVHNIILSWSKSSFGFFISYGKRWMNFLANPYVCNGNMDLVAICFYRESEDKEMAKMTQEEDVDDRKAKHKNLTEVARLQAKYSLPENRIVIRSIMSTIRNIAEKS